MKKIIENPNDEQTDFKETDMPFRYYQFDYSDGFSGFQFHWHEEIEIHYVVSGSGSFFIDDAEYNVGKGDIIFIAPRIIHSGKSENNNLIDICYIVDNDYLMSKNNEYNTDKFFTGLINTKVELPVIHMQNEGYEQLRTPLQLIDSCVERRGPFFQLEIKRNLFDFFIEMYKNNYLSMSSPSSNHIETKSIVKQSISYIQQNASGKLTIDEIASHVGLSSSYFMKLFKECTKMTCVEYIKILRLNNAANMLKETDESILQIAHTCGFFNLSLFNREFKRYYSITPSLYRKKYKMSEIDFITF